MSAEADTNPSNVASSLDEIPPRELERWECAPPFGQDGRRMVKFEFYTILEIACTYPDFLEYVTDRLARWKQGRYRLTEAIQVISEAYPGEVDVRTFRMQSNRAVWQGKLVIRMNGVRVDMSDLSIGGVSVSANPIVETRDFNEWLANEGSPYRLSYPYLDKDSEGLPSGSQDKVVLKSTRQRELILQWLTSNGYNPEELPPRMRGKSGPKADVKAAMLKNANMFTEKSFEKAWESLRSDGSLLGAD
ncbi:hypothetical protein [uncultured Massilia sp.]|uniref:hypothetical protein n=1 Tax=uncultured Massilia sp. TaxID=169973 RepID=UPI0025CF927E|nr:hypothetical protein [uncultured Massilia sp.]